MEQNVEALAKAVTARREELGMTQGELAEQSRRLELLLYPNQEQKRPGLSIRTWSELERGIHKERRGRTQLVIDATLKWPRGTAAAYLYDRPLPDGPPVVPDQDAEDGGGELERARRRSDTARMLREVAELRAEVADLAVAVAQLARRRGVHDVSDGGDVFS